MRGYEVSEIFLSNRKSLGETIDIGFMGALAACGGLSTIAIHLQAQ